VSVALSRYPRIRSKIDTGVSSHSSVLFEDDDTFAHLRIGKNADDEARRDDERLRSSELVWLVLLLPRTSSSSFDTADDNNIVPAVAVVAVAVAAASFTNNKVSLHFASSPFSFSFDSLRPPTSS